jgi:hypothetical protein
MWPLDLARRGRSAAGPGGTETRGAASRRPHARARAWASRPGPAGQYSFLITKYDPRIVPASFDF